MKTYYYIDYSDSSKPTFVVRPGEFNTENASVVFLGTGTGFYGKDMNQNMLRLLENFSYDEEPKSPTEGQVWYNAETERTYVYGNTGEWSSVDNMKVTDTAPTDPSDGDLWWDTTPVASDSAEHRRELKMWLWGAWRHVVDDYLTRDGRKLMTGDLDMDNHAILEVGQPAAPISNNTPAIPAQLATTKYVHDYLIDVSGDNVLGSLTFDNVTNLIVSEAANSTYTISGGTSGSVGAHLWNATFTGSGYEHDSSTAAPVMIRANPSNAGNLSFYDAAVQTVGTAVAWQGGTSLSGNNLTASTLLHITNNLDIVTGEIYSGGTQGLTDGNFETLKTESVQDIIGAMFSSNTENGINVTYDDNTGKLNFNMDDPTFTFIGDVTGSSQLTDLSNITIDGQVLNDSHTHDYLYYTRQETQDLITDAVENYMWQKTLSDAEFMSLNNTNNYFCTNSTTSYNMFKWDSRNAVWYYMNSGHRTFYDGYSYSYATYSPHGPIAVVTNYTSETIQYRCQFQLNEMINDYWQWRLIRNGSAIYTQTGSAFWWSGCYGRVRTMGLATDDIPPGATHTYYLQGRFWGGHGYDQAYLRTFLSNTVVQL